MPRLVLLHEGQATPHSLDRLPIRIGRHPDCEMQLDSNMVSRFHAEVRDTAGSASIVDLDSGNGTFLNGKRLGANTPAKLRPGDRIKIGPIKIRYEDENSPESGSNISGINIEITGDSSSTIMGSASAKGYGLLGVKPEEKLAGVLEISRNLAGLVDGATIAPRILDTLFRIFPQADRGTVLLMDEEEDRMVPAAQKLRNEADDETVRLSSTIVDQVIEDKQGILSADASTDERFTGSESISNLTIRSMMCAPLLNLEDKPIGIINLDTQNPLNRFQNEDLEVLLAVACQAALSFDTARLMKTYLEKQKQDKEMKIARDVQRALLPEQLPVVDGYEFFASYDAAQAVGGDYFDCFRMGEDKVCVSFGDVAGKGVPGALIMSRISSVVQSTMQFTDHVETAIHKINKHMCHHMADGRFVTYILGVINLKTNRITLANCGHMSPLIRTPDGKVDEFDEETIGIPIGIMEEYPYEVVSRVIAPGETIVLITDGVDEAMDPNGELYTKNRVRDFIASHSPNPEQLGKDLLADVRRHANGRAQNDDITIMTFGRRA